jgi:hypothetical protein
MSTVNLGMEQMSGCEVWGKKDSLAMSIGLGQIVDLMNQTSLWELIGNGSKKFTEFCSSTVFCYHTVQEADKILREFMTEDFESSAMSFLRCFW